MKTEQLNVFELIKSAGAAAALSADGDCPVEIETVSFIPSAGNGGNRFATIQINWTTGPAWGQVRLEFKPDRPGEPSGVWKRAAGVAMLPGGLPMLPALSLALNEIANVALTAADDHLPAGIAPATAV